MMTTSRLSGLGILIALAWVFNLSGCVSINDPKGFDITGVGAPKRIDSTHVPPTNTHAEARRLLEEAYERNGYLEERCAKLEAENRKLEAERDEFEDRYEMLKDRYED